MIKRVLLFVGCLFVGFFLTTAVANCQEKQPDTIKVSAEYFNTRADQVNVTFPNGVTIPVPVLESHALGGTVSVKALSRSRFSFRFAGEFSTNFNRSRFHQYAGGTQVFFKLFEQRVEPFGEFLVGVYRPENGVNHFVKIYGGGLDVRLTSRFGFRAFRYNRQVVDLFPLPATRISSGVFVVF